MNTPTPRTDENAQWSNSCSFEEKLQMKVCELMFAKTLERELAAVTEQRDRLAEALRMITTFDYTDLQCDNGYGPRYIATEALQSLNQPEP